MTIRVEIGGKRAIVVGSARPLTDEIAAALDRNGAAVLRAGNGQGDAAFDILVIVATDLAFERKGVEVLCREAFARMSDGGRMVIVASALGLVPAREEAAESVRAAGLLALARTLAMEFATRAVSRSTPWRLDRSRATPGSRHG